MPKVVVNACYGGFGLSRQAVERLAALGHEGAQEQMDSVSKGEHFYGYCDIGQDEDRADPRLVQVVEELGAKAASGDMASLRIAEVPDGVEWEFDEYDGIETIREKHRSW